MKLIRSINDHSMMMRVKFNDEVIVADELLPFDRLNINAFVHLQT